VKLNENSRKNQDKLHTDYIEAMNANQKCNTETLSKVETDLRSMEEKMKLEKRNVRDEFRKTEIRFDDTDSDIKSKMKSFKDQIDIDQESLHEQVKQDMDIVHDSVNSNLEELKSKVNTLINSDIASSTREITGFRSTIENMLGKVSEISAQVGEINRNRDNNLLIHGLPTQVQLKIPISQSSFCSRKRKILTL